MYFFPEPNDEIILGFLNNDPRFAVIVGSLYGKKNKPPFTPEEKNMNKAIVTRSKMKITFEEEKKIITVETPGGQKVTLDDDSKSLKLEDQNKNSLILDIDTLPCDTLNCIEIERSSPQRFFYLSSYDAGRQF